MSIPGSILTGAAAAALLVVGVARAAVPFIDTHAFTLQGYEDYPDSGIALVADSPDRVSLTFPLMAARLGEAPADSGSAAGSGDWHSNTSSFQSLYDIHFKPGYHITGVTMSTTVFGAMALGEGEPPGDAGNYMNVRYDLWRAGTSGDMSVSFLHGSEIVSTASSGLDLQESFTLYLSGNSITWASSGWLYDPVTKDFIRTPSTAEIGLRDVTLTFAVAPVPEPGTGLMLAAGLFALAVLHGRRPA